ncbi:uncharacterized protein HMPREF1541_08936 [Cyphellophora europaea CBS 101466]|uniref:Uncharacterized protein n=1 Tax=Cyphellophora europaea (strain CBS 101466) TaxID=1220924 RepID=W2RLS1_CYPE1|nr:uncharacterized protein HMPREF1541_08936 [Cyphellophora europaea CBS 101466]ETN36658.1 hypothetical protein HMPREF1541_08936 [Cyphellophora europaea CBS 101466]
MHIPCTVQRLGLYLLILQIFTTLTVANVEKVIFVAPDTQEFPSDASLDNLLLERLTLAKASVRTRLNATFPTDEQPRGTETWMLLEDLTPGQRYEVRICWLATQPTSFWLYTHTSQSTFESPELISALTLYSNTRHQSATDETLEEAQSRVDLRQRTSFPTTFLFLQIFAAADYFSLDKSLMEVVPPVHVDIILDPYLLNIFPQSLLPTAGYIIIIAVLGWFVSGWIYTSYILPYANAGIETTPKKSD